MIFGNNVKRSEKFYYKMVPELMRGTYELRACAEDLLIKLDSNEAIQEEKAVYFYNMIKKAAKDGRETTNKFYELINTIQVGQYLDKHLIIAVRLQLERATYLFDDVEEEYIPALKEKMIKRFGEHIVD